MFLFKLTHADGTPADPPTVRVAVPNWRAGDTITVGHRSLRVIRFATAYVGFGPRTRSKIRTAPSNAGFRTQAREAPSLLYERAFSQ